MYMKCYTCRDTGKCQECDGSGQNPHLNSDDPRCPGCHGSGSCSVCGPQEGTITLFGKFRLLERDA
jgi:hypothetical protein